MNNPMTKEYLFFFKAVLASFNKINACFQRSDTLVLCELLQRFMKSDLLESNNFDKEAGNINFRFHAQHRVFKNYLLVKECAGVPNSDINQVRHDCLQFT